MPLLRMLADGGTTWETLVTITGEHRLVYAVEPHEITIISCRYHYE